MGCRRAGSICGPKYTKQIQRPAAFQPRLHQPRDLRDFADDPERSEYFVPVDWLQTVDIDAGVQEVGMFGNQNTVCKPTTPKWRQTVERLKQRFPDFDKEFSKQGSVWRLMASKVPRAWCRSAVMDRGQLPGRQAAGMAIGLTAEPRIDRSWRGDEYSKYISDVFYQNRHRSLSTRERQFYYATSMRCLRLKCEHQA